MAKRNLSMSDIGASVLEKATTHRRGTLEIIAAIESQPLLNLEPSTEGLTITSDHDIRTDRRRHSSNVRPKTPSAKSSSVNASSNLAENARNARKRSSILESFRAIFSRRKSSRRKSDALKATRHRLEAAQITTSDFDISYGRPVELRGLSFDIEWWWLTVASGRHRSMAIFLAFLIALIITHVVMAIIMFTTELEPEDPYLCETEGCEIIAGRIRDTINTSQDPCDDFYKFVCGDFHRPTSSTSAMTENSWTLSSDAIAFSFKESKALGKMLRTKKKFPYNILLPFHKACMDKRYRDKAGLGPYQQLLKKYHLVELDRVKNGNSLEKILADLYKDDILTRPLFSFELDLQLREYRIQRPRYSGEIKALKSGISAYKKGMTDMLNHVNSKIGLESTSDQTLELLICFELILFHDVTDIPWEVEIGALGNCSFDSIPTTSPKIADLKFKNFFKNLFGNRITDILSWKAADNSKRHVDSIKYEDLLMGLLAQVDFEFIVRFLRWLTLREYAGELDAVTASKDCAIDKYSNKCRPIATCFWSMFKVMPFLASVSFIEALEKKINFHPEVDLMLNYILNSTIEVVRLSRSEKNKFLGTFSRVVEDVFRRVRIIYPIRLAEKYSASNMTDLDSIFNGLTMGKDHLTNIISVRHIEGRNLISSHLKIKTSFSWTLRPKYQIQIFSKNLMNSLLTVPVGSLEPPFFQSTFPALDVSANGFFVAQSLARIVFHDYFLRLKVSKTREKSFTGSGMTYSQFLMNVLLPYQRLLEESSKALQTDLRPHLWDLDGEPFMPKEAVPYNMYVNQLADQFALKVSFIAHEKYFKTKTRFTRQKLKGLTKYSPQQIFFMSLASFRCQKYPATQLRHMMKFGPIPYPISVNMLAANSREFSETFNCPYSSAKLNPETKINLYDD